MGQREVKYEVSEPSDGLSIWVDDADFEGMDAGEIEYAIGEAIQEHFLERVGWHSESRPEVVAAIIADKESSE